MNRFARIALPAACLALAACGANAQILGPAGQSALENARSGTVVQWQDPDRGATGAIVPQPAFTNAAGEICREFQQTVTIGGQPQQAYGAACRQPDGTWRLQRASTQEAPLPPPRFVPAPAPVVVYAPPPPVIYPYPPVYFPPGYYYSRPYYSVFVFGGGRGYGHGHGHRH